MTQLLQTRRFKEALARVQRLFMETQGVKLTTTDAALMAGARGYLLKGSEPTDIARAVRSVAEGDAIFGPAIAGRMMALFARRTARPRWRSAAWRSPRGRCRDRGPSAGSTGRRC